MTGSATSSVVDPNTLNLDPDTEFWTNLAQDPKHWQQELRTWLQLLLAYLRSCWLSQCWPCPGRRRRSWQRTPRRRRRCEGTPPAHALKGGAGQHWTKNQSMMRTRNRNMEDHLDPDPHGGCGYGSRTRKSPKNCQNNVLQLKFKKLKF